MFSTSNQTDIEKEKKVEPTNKKETVPYLNRYNNNIESNSINLNTLDSLLEKEQEQNKTEQWNKIDKIVKTQLLHAFSEKYGKEHKLPMKEIKGLKTFFSESLNRGKLQKNKDVTYDKDNQQILSVPALFFNNDKKNFTLRITDTKRVSTLKSLAPKKNTSLKSTSNDKID